MQPQFVSMPAAITPRIVLPNIPNALISPAPTPIAAAPPKKGPPFKYTTDEERKAARKESKERSLSRPYVQSVNDLQQNIDDHRYEMIIQTRRIDKLYDMMQEVNQKLNRLLEQSGTRREKSNVVDDDTR